MIAPDPESSVYRQLAARLRERIDNGELPPGRRMPSEKDLSDEFGLARETVRRAMAVLRQEGRVIVEHGRGTVVADPPPTITLAAGDRATVLGGTLRVTRAGGAVETYPAGTTVLTDESGS